MDELSIAGHTHATLYTAGSGPVELQLAPEDFGLPRHPLEAVKGGSPSENASTFRSVLAGTPGPVLDYVLLNAAAAIYVAGRVSPALSLYLRPELCHANAQAWRPTSRPQAGSQLRQYPRARLWLCSTITSSAPLACFRTQACSVMCQVVT